MFVPVRLDRESCVPLQLMSARLCAGFPSPAEDHVERALDPAVLLIQNPISTFLWRVEGVSMIEAGIFDGDVVVVDRSLKPRGGDVVVAVIDGTPSLKKLVRRGGRLVVEFANATLGPLVLPEESEVSIWGVVTWSLHPHRPAETVTRR